MNNMIHDLIIHYRYNRIRFLKDILISCHHGNDYDCQFFDKVKRTNQCIHKDSIGYCTNGAVLIDVLQETVKMLEYKITK